MPTSYGPFPSLEEESKRDGLAPLPSTGEDPRSRKEPIGYSQQPPPKTALPQKAQSRPSSNPHHIEEQPQYETRGRDDGSPSDNVLIDSIIAEINSGHGGGGTNDATGSRDTLGEQTSALDEPMGYAQDNDSILIDDERSKGVFRMMSDGDGTLTAEPPADAVGGGSNGRRECIDEEDEGATLVGNCYESRFWVSILKALRDPIVVGLVVALVSSPRVQRRAADVMPLIIGGDTVYSTLSRVFVGIVTFILIRRLM